MTRAMTRMIAEMMRNGALLVPFLVTDPGADVVDFLALDPPLGLLLRDFDVVCCSFTPWNVFADGFVFHPLIE